MTHAVAGFLAPPGWSDPSPREFSAMTGVEAIGVSLDLGDFDWRLDSVATTESTLTESATMLAARGASIVGIVGTPFGWAGLGPRERPHDRNDRIAVACGVPVVSAVSGMLDWLDDLGARSIALAATYYDADWCDRWKRFVADEGYAVTACVSMADLGIVDDPLAAADPTHWEPTPDQIERTIVGAIGPSPVDAVVVSGAGARTLGCHRRLRRAAGAPIVSADLGLYRAMHRRLGLATTIECFE